MEQGWNMTGCYQDARITAERNERGQCYLAELDGKLVATALLTTQSIASEPEVYSSGRAAVFGQFAVDPEYRGLKLGDALLDYAETDAKRLGFLTIALDTIETATYLIEYYERRGFSAVGHVQWSGKTYRSVVMAKSLG